MTSFLKSIKKSLYFHVARYFGFFAARVLKKWQPKIIVVTGSSGKTTMLNMLEAQLGDKAVFSHAANSAIGIPFHILGMTGIEDSRWEWIGKFLRAPFASMNAQHKRKIYVVEADADRPGEGLFLAKLLKPDVTVWVSSARTHTMNFTALVENKKFDTVEAAIAHEYAHFAKRTKELVITDGDNPNIKAALQDVTVTTKYVKHDEAIRDYRLSDGQCMVSLSDKRAYLFDQPQPPVISYQVVFLDEVLRYLRIEPDYGFTKLNYPPGRSRVFKSALGMTMIDSTYNSNLDSLNAMLRMFELYPGEDKILVLGDMLEHGSREEEEHRKMADLILNLSFKPKQIVLLGPRVKRYTYPILREEMSTVPISIFVNPRDVLDYLRSEARGGEVVLFKGARFLEGVIENLLADPEEAKYLCRRGTLWRKRRAEWGL